MMKAEDVIFGISALLSIVSNAWGDGCSDLQTSGAAVLSMCQQSSMTLGLAYLSMATDTMGSSTRCECTLRSRTPGMTTNTEFLLYTNDSHVSKCDQSLIQITPFGSASSSGTPTFTCTSPRGSYFYTGNTTEDVTVTLTRPDTIVGVSYCVQVLSDRRAEMDIQISCTTGTVVTQTTSISTSPPSAAPSSSFPSTTPPSSSNTTSQSLTSSLSSTSSAGPSTSRTTSDGKSVTASGHSTYSTAANSYSNSEDFQVAPIAGGVSGAVVLSVIIFVIVVIVCKRYRTKLLAARQTEADNSAYTSLSDVTRVNPRADPNYAVIQSGHSSSQPGGSDATAPTGVYETVDGGSSATPDVTHVSRSNDGAGTYYNAEAIQQL